MGSVQYLAMTDYALYINSYWNCIKMMHHNFICKCLNGFLNVIYFMEDQIYNPGILPNMLVSRTRLWLFSSLIDTRYYILIICQIQA